jgi:hypothetical protein
LPGKEINTTPETAEPPIGKYEIFSRDIGTPPYQVKYLYLTST